MSKPPLWINDQIINPMVKNNIVKENFINSIAMNIYHDGTEGLAQHYDDATRFRQPIYTLRLFSDSRLSFGSQFYGYYNSGFFIPLPRGCICVMSESGYAANGITHCIRPVDMEGKSVALILRQIHPDAVKEAEKYDRNIDMAQWLSTISLKDYNNEHYQVKNQLLKYHQ